MKKTPSLIPENSSYYGLAGLVISIISILLILGFFFTPDAKEGSLWETAGTIALFGGVFLSFVGLLCSTVNLFEKEKNKTLGIIGLILSLSTGFFAVIVLILGVFGAMMEQ